MAITKPTVDTATWGNTNTSSPDMVTPGAGLVNTGFLAYPVKLKRGHLNWLVNKLHQGLRYYMAQGIPAWDATETNYALDSVVTYSGLAYKLNTAAPAGTNPATDTAHWGLLVPPSPGSLLRRSFLTSGTTLAKATGCVKARAWIYGGGGGGGGAASDGNIGSGIGGGGAAGSWGYLETSTIPATWAYAIGAAGGAGSGSPTDGTAGGSSTLSDGATTWTAPGGGGGGQVNLVGSSAAPRGSAGQPGAAASVTAGPGSIVGYAGTAGQQGWFQAYAAFDGELGGGASLSPYGAGGRPVVLTNAGPYPGYAAAGRCSGGSGGGVTTVQPLAAGGAGAGGLILLEEYT